MKDKEIKEYIKELTAKGRKATTRMQAINKMWLAGKKFIPYLTKEITNKDWSIRWFAMTGLVWFGKDAVPELIKMLKHKNWRMRGGATEVLSIINDKKAVPAIKKLLKDKNEKVRNYAKMSLDRLKK